MSKLIKSIKGIVALALFVFLAGCFAKPKVLTHGPQPVDVESKIINYLEPHLRDASSAKIIIDDVRKGYGNYGWGSGGDVHWVGWVVLARVNGKNGFGGYTGYKRYLFGFDDSGSIQAHYENTGFSDYSHPLVTTLEN